MESQSHPKSVKNQWKTSSRLCLEKWCKKWSKSSSIWKDFGMIFALNFNAYCYAWCVAWRCENHRFVLVFTVFAVRRPFHTKQKHQNFVVKMVGVFREGCRHHFFVNLGFQSAPKISRTSLKNVIHRASKLQLKNMRWKSATPKWGTPKIFFDIFKGLGPRVPHGGPKDLPRAQKVDPKLSNAKLQKWDPKLSNVNKK